MPINSKKLPKGLIALIAGDRELDRAFRDVFAKSEDTDLRILDLQNYRFYLPDASKTNFQKKIADIEKQIAKTNSTSIEIIKRLDVIEKKLSTVSITEIIKRLDIVEKKLSTVSVAEIKKRLDELERFPRGLH